MKCLLSLSYKYQFNREVKRVYKPNFVPALTGDDHSSRPTVACRLERPTRKRRRIASALSGQLKCASLFGLAPRGVYLAATVTNRAGELLPHRFTHHPFGLVCSLLHLSSSRFHASPGRYPARCPMVFGLSSSAYRRSDHPTRFTV